MATVYKDRNRWRLDITKDAVRRKLSFPTEKEAYDYALANDLYIRERKPTRPPLSVIKTNSLKRIDFQERQFIEKLLKEGYSLRNIATSLKRGKTTISYEIHKGGGYKNYNAEKAHNSTLSMVNVNLKDLLDQIESKMMAVEIFLERFEILEKHLQKLEEKYDNFINTKL